jgi:hypothetical protein
LKRGIEHGSQGTIHRDDKTPLKRNADRPFDSSRRPRSTEKESIAVPEHPEIPDTPVWTAWQALPRTDSALNAAVKNLENAENAESPAATPKKLLSRDDVTGFLGCFLPLVMIASLWRAFRLMARAADNGETDLLPWLLIVHVPFAILLVFSLRRLLTADRKRTEKEGRPPELQDAWLIRKITITEQGVQSSTTEFYGWERFQSFAFLGTETGEWYRIRLYAARAAGKGLLPHAIPLPSRIKVAVRWFVTIAAIVLPFVGSVVLFALGLSRWGGRADVTAAFYLAFAHFIWLGAAGVLELREKLLKKRRPDQEAAARERAVESSYKHFDFLLNAHEVTVTEAVRRLERYLPLEPQEPRESRESDEP